MSSKPPHELDRERQAFALLSEVCELETEVREQALGACGDPELADAVRQKLAARDSVIGWLEPSPGPRTERPPIQRGDQIGPFEVRGLLGEGGLGRVFRAVQHEPVKRQVALKIVRLARLQGDAHIRFEAERQAMARLDHPNIGRILEAGTTGDGQPFFAMELIDGPPITEYCNHQNLSIERRLQLFVEVCRGTHHAHRKLLLHRDLKPSNVLVAELDGRALPKIIDFGIAKGLGAPLVTEAAPTGEGFLGTPAYISPEALEPGQELDARSDVFSLGVLLYELLTGGSPWGPVPDRDPLQLVKRRLERDAERPSTLVAALEEARRTRAAAERQLTAEGLAKRLSGDLDSLVMKAIEPQPERRYESAAELADDIERHLASEPILARPLTTGVLLRKLIRRNRGPVIAAGVTALAVVGGSIGTAVGLVRAQDAERQALASKDQALADARDAEEARQEADQVVEFLFGIFRDANPGGLESKEPVGELTALELLDRGADRLEHQDDLKDQPTVRSRLAETLGQLFRQLGEFDRSTDLFRLSIDTLEASESPQGLRLARAHIGLSETELLRTERATAAQHLHQALELLDDRDDDGAIRLRAPALNSVARLRWRDGDLDGAEQAFLESIEIYESLGDLFVPAVANVRSNLGGLYLALTRFEDAETQLKHAVDIYGSRTEGEHPQLADLKLGLGGALASQGRLEEAARLFEDAERVIREQRGENHHSRATALANLGLLHRDVKQFERSLTYLQEALSVRERALGDGHPLVGDSLSLLAWTLTDLDRDDEAREAQERALAIFEGTLGAEHPNIARSLKHLGTLATRRSDHPLAFDYATRHYDLVVKSRGAGDPSAGEAAENLAETLWQLRRRGEARERFLEAKAVFEAGGNKTREALEELDARLEELGIAR
ncbi:MAG: serine/threonine-protein kinase [Acidobacteriota bacterium]